MNIIASLSVEPEQAALWFLGQAGYLIRAAGITIVIPNHYDMMAGNREGPGEFVHAMHKEAPDIPARILQVLEPFQLMRCNHVRK